MKPGLIFFNCSTKISCFMSTFIFLAVKYIMNPLMLHLCYFTALSLLGYFLLSVTKPRTHSTTPKTLDVFFTSVSAATDSSMGTVEMEVFSNSQLIIMTILMLAGGEVFMSMLELFFIKSKLPKYNDHLLITPSSKPTKSVEQIELNFICCSEKTDHISFDNKNKNNNDNTILKHNSIRYLCYVVLGYFLIVHVGGSCLVLWYISLIPSAKHVLEQKGLQAETFSVFTIVSTFSNCGFVPTNENMIVFKENSGLLLLLIPQVLLGNTLYPACLRFAIWVLKKITKREECDYLLKNYREIGYDHLLSRSRSCFLAITVFGFIIVQLVIFCSLEWNSEAMDDLNFYQKLVASLFEVVNSRHTGESVLDLSIISPAILVLFVVMMYLPPYTSFLPTRNCDEGDSKNCKEKEKETKSLLECLVFSQLSYLAIFIILICITERHKMKQDPLNFNVLSITIEVISAYGNVGFSTGYSCERQLKPEISCKDKWFGLVGKWSNGGKLILILVMFFGRIKKFIMKGGKAWKLS